MFKPTLSLTSQQLSFLLGFKPILIQAGESTKVPWQCLAGIWYRESFSVAPTRNGGGPMQFDPPPTASEIEGLLKKYTLYNPGEIEKMKVRGTQDFKTALVYAGCFLREKQHGFPITTDDEVKIAMWRYNGVVGKEPEDSPYVYNGFDEAHTGMHFSGSLPSGNSRAKVDFVDKRPGAFVVYKQLVEGNF